jgi:hypothetical protein
LLNSSRFGGRPFEPKDMVARRIELQRRYWEIALWLDAPVLRELNKFALGGGEQGVQHKIALIHVRKLIVGDDDDVTHEELVHWDPTPPSISPILQ